MDRDSIPIGIDDFKKLRSVDAYYIDKSMLIDQILSQRATEVFLFTRPRRFGKSLNLSMLDAYLNRNYKGNGWFDGLEISDSGRFESEKNSNVVICMNMKDLDGPYDSFIIKMRKRIKELYGGFTELEDSPELKRFEKDDYSDHLYKELPAELLQFSLRSLSIYLKKHYGRPPIILIDEYDDAVNRAANESERRRIIEFMRVLLSSALKGNEAIRFAVITGAMQIAKEAIFSGLNHLYINNVFSDRYDEMFGFTPDEVRRVCADFGRPDRFDEARDWYDGYRFGNADIYNPWSVLMYAFESFKPAAYWVRTSGNSIIPALLRSIDRHSAGNARLLMEGGAFITTLSSSIAYSDNLNHNPESFFSAMVMSGYLTAVQIGHPEKGKYLVAIPNRELMRIFRKEVFESIDTMGENRYMEFIDAAASSDTGGMRDVLVDVLANIGMNLLPSSGEGVGGLREANYNILLLAIVSVAPGLYKATADMDAGNGRADIKMVSRVPGRSNIIMELKWRDDADADLDSVAESAIGQIHDKMYYLDMKGRTILYGIAFRKRDVRIRCEEHVQRDRGARIRSMG